MDKEKVGLFIKQLREEMNLTQEELAEKVFCGREAVSKWERGKNLPDRDPMLILSKIFEVTVDEILAGERDTTKDITLELYDDTKKLNKKIKRNLIVSALIIFICITVFLSYYFINQYKTIHTYTVTGFTKTFSIENGLFLRTDDRQYFSIGNITSKDDIEIDKIELYYVENNKEHLICARESDEMLLIDRRGYEEYFNLKKIDYILDNLYLRIYYEDNTDEVKLDLIEDYVNDRLIFDKVTEISSDNENDNNISKKNVDEKLIEKIKKKFTNIDEDGNYTYKLKENESEKLFTFFPIDNTMIVTTFKKQKAVEDYTYDLNNKSVVYIYYKEREQSYSLVYSNNEYYCAQGDCLDGEEKIEKFLKLLEKVLA